MVGRCSGPPDASARTNLSELGRRCPAINSGLVRKLASRLARSLRAARRCSNVLARGMAVAGSDDPAAASANVAWPAALRS
eukprot:14824028-Alexandrium_andersonii.AAC.1